MEKQIARIAEESFARACGRKKAKECPYFAAYADRKGLASRSELDRQIYKEMYGETEPLTEAGLQRVRFWRLGRHAPKSRAEAVRLAKILALTEAEQNQFLTEQWEFPGLHPPVAEERCAILHALFFEYLCQIDGERLAQLSVLPGTQEKYMRHIFYADAVDCIHMAEEERSFFYPKHLYSRGMETEFRKYFRADTALSRAALIKILLILLLPDVDREALDRLLVQFGYGRLNPDRFLSGARDYAVGALLDLAQKHKSGDRAADKIRMKALFAAYDKEIKKRIRECENRKAKKEAQAARRLRFLSFRGLESRGISEGRPD